MVTFPRDAPLLTWRTLGQLTVIGVHEWKQYQVSEQNQYLFEIKSHYCFKTIITFVGDLSFAMNNKS